MRHGVGTLVLLLLLSASLALVEDDGEEDDELMPEIEEKGTKDAMPESDKVNMSPQERKIMDRYDNMPNIPPESRKYQKLVDEIENELTELYDDGKGVLTESSLILLGDLSRRAVSQADIASLGVARHEAMMNKAGIYYEDAYERYNSTEGYFRLALVVESLGKMQGEVGNESRQEELVSQANGMFAVCGSKGHADAMKLLFDNCEKNMGFGPDGCPDAIKTQVFKFYEKAMNQSGDPVTMGKIAIFYAHGFGCEADLPKACSYAKVAAKANAVLLQANQQKKSAKLTDQKLEEIGYNKQNFILLGNCQYFNNFAGSGDAIMRTEGRATLKAGLDYQLHMDKEQLLDFEETLMQMIGPEKEPTYSGSIEWSQYGDDELGEMWYVYLWAPSTGTIGQGFFWTPKIRLGDMPVTIEKKGDGLVDISGERPPFELKAVQFIPPSKEVPIGQLKGSARRQTGETTFLDGNFTFMLVPNTEDFHAEL